MECLKRKYLIKIKKQAQNFKEEYIDIKGIHIPFIGIFLLWLALYLTSEEKRLDTFISNLFIGCLLYVFLCLIPSMVIIQKLQSKKYCIGHPELYLSKYDNDFYKKYFPNLFIYTAIAQKAFNIVLTGVTTGVIITVYLYNLLGFNINTNKAYKYIINHPLEYMAYIHKKYDRNKEYFQSCIADTNCKLIKRALKSDKEAFYFKNLSQTDKKTFIIRKIESLQQMCAETVDSMTPQALFIDYQVMKKLKEDYSEQL